MSGKLYVVKMNGRYYHQITCTGEWLPKHRRPTPAEILECGDFSYEFGALELATKYSEQVALGTARSFGSHTTIEPVECGREEL